MARADWAGAEAKLSAWLARHPGDNNALLRLGGVLCTLGRDVEAIAAYGRVAGKARARAEARFQVGELALRRHDLAGAERAFREAAGLDLKAAGPRRRLVFALTLQQRNDEGARRLVGTLPTQW